MIRAIALALYFSASALTAQAQTLSLPLDEQKDAKPQTVPSITQPAASAPEKKEVERVEVTGSHIKRIDVEGASEVQTITRKDLEKTGYNSVADVLRDTSANSFGSAREEAGSNAAGVASVDLRGLGASNTLVLLNGQRLPSDAVTGAVDLNLIPMAAVERVEILKDGASAIYGSDALGGVVNIITRKDFNGSEIAINQNTPEQAGGRRQDISLVNGFSKGKVNMVNIVQYRDNQAVMDRDRSWSNNQVSNLGSPGSYKAGGTWHADPNCPPDQVKHTAQGDFCTFKFSDYATSLPALQQISVMNETNVELNSRVKLTARAGGSQKKVQWSFAPAPGSFTVPGGVADHLGPGGGPLPGANPGEDVTVNYRLKEMGTRDTQVTTNSYNFLLGTTVQAMKGWEIGVTAAHNRVDSADKGINGYALESDVTNAISSGALNPFQPEGQRGATPPKYVPIEKTASILSSADLKASGEIGHLPAGRMGLAVGTSFTFQKYSDLVDDKTANGEVFGGAGSSGMGQRDTRAVYSELSIPLTKKLEMQLAGRYDHYSDFGDTANPKAALLYHASKSILLRGSAGTGFKAPLLQEMYAGKSNGYQTFVDAQACKMERAAGGDTSSCLPQQYLVTSGGNPGLRQETSESYSIGAIYEPNRDFNIGSDFFLARMKNVVGIDYDEAFIAGDKSMQDHGVIVHRDAQGYIDPELGVEAPMQNLSSQQTAGVDISGSYRIWKTRYTIDHTQMFFFKEEGFPGQGQRNKLGENGKPPWRNTVAATLMPTENQDITLAALTIAGQQKEVKEMGRLNNYTELQLQYAYKSKAYGTFTLGVKNLLAAKPPIDDSNSTVPLNTTIYDQVGRMVVTGYKATF